MLAAATQFGSFTYRDYCALPDDGTRYELMDGGLFVVPAPSTSHQTSSRLLQFELMRQIEMRGLGQVFNAPCDLIFNDRNVVQPDLILISREREVIITKRAIEGIPDVVVEILSPSNRERDLLAKKFLYEQFRVPEYWIVHPNAGLIDVLALSGEGAYVRRAHLERGDTLTCPAFPELSVDLARVFRHVDA